MILSRLDIQQFRNVAALQLQPGPGANLFYGLNGTGKTNLLEAIFTLCLGRSQKGSLDNVLVREGETTYRLEGKLESRGRRHEVAVAWQQGVGKRITIDGVAAKASDLFRTFCAVAAGPEDSELLSGAPSHRRLFLDMYLAQLSAAYLADLGAYQRAVSQKNAALKRQMDPDPFDELLVTYGCRLMAARCRFCTDLATAATAYYGRIADVEVMTMQYEPSVSLSADSDSAEAFRQALAAVRERERALGSAVVGPHRDDIRVEIGGRPARSFGSQGQWRTAAVALKLGVYDLLRERRDQPPLLLLDEIFAELDPQRTMQLVEAIAGCSQVFITSSHEPPESLRRQGVCFRVTDGAVTAEST